MSNAGMLQRVQHAWTGLVVALVVTAGCAAPSPNRGDATGASSVQQSNPGVSAPARQTRPLQIALQGFQEPKTGIVEAGGPAGGGFDPLEHFLIFHASPTVYDQQGRLVPRLVEKLPSVQDGDWRVMADGRMEVTWKLKANLVWHDGTPLSAEDFVFGAQVVKDPEIPATRPAWAPLVTEVHAPDPRTFVMHWKEASFLGGGSGPSDVIALPRHKLSDAYQASDKQVFINSPYWTTEFVGLGPYKLTRWERGSFIEGEAFDRYILGRPKIDRVIIRYVGDVNAIVAGMLGGDLDLVPMGTRFDAGQVITVRDGLGEPAFAQVVPFGIRTVWLQFRDPAAPWARDIRVRRALAHALDRQGMSEALQYGLTPPADTFIMTEDSAFRPLQTQGFNRYPFDLGRTHQLMAEAGWPLAPDGMLRSAGLELAIEVSATGQGSNVQEIETVASQWRGAGFAASPIPLPPQASNLDERKNTVKGGFVWPWTPNQTAPQNLVISQISSERTAWKGRNYGGYANPAYDALYERFATTLDATARDNVVADIMKLIAEDVPVIPIYYYGTGVVARKGLTGPGMISPLQTASAWNIESWELR